MRVEGDAALGSLLDEACRAAGVPGAALAVLEGGVIRTAEAGMADMGTGAPVTAATRFPAWSLQKAFTAMLVLELVEEGRLGLDDPVRRYVPELRLAPGADEPGDAITVRQLLANTSGLGGAGQYPPTGAGDDALERYLAAAGGALDLVHPPGERFAYCNPGYVLAGLVVERLRGQTYDAALAERVLGPLGLRETGTSPAQLGDAPVVADHRLGPDGTAEPLARRPWPYQGMGPAGFTLFATAADLARFAAGALAPRWAALSDPQVPVPGPHTEAWGLGWAVFGWGAGVAGWDGVGPGIRTFLRVLPRHGAAVVLLTNANQGRRIYRSLLPPLLGERFGVAMAPERPPMRPFGDGPADLARHAGVYRNGATTRTVALAEDGAGLLLDGVRLLPTDEAGTFVQEPADVEYPVVKFDGDFASVFAFGYRR